MYSHCLRLHRGNTILQDNNPGGYFDKKRGAALRERNKEWFALHIKPGIWIWYLRLSFHFSPFSTRCRQKYYVFICIPNDPEKKNDRKKEEQLWASKDCVHDLVVSTQSSELSKEWRNASNRIVLSLEMRGTQPHPTIIFLRFFPSSSSNMCAYKRKACKI